MKSILKNNTETNGVKQKLSSAGDLVRLLDESLHRAKTVPELFSARNNVVRVRLREVCEQIILADTEEPGRKAEDLLWRKVHYEPYSLAKQMGQSAPLSAYEISLLSSHLLAGIGSYHMLIVSMQAHQSLDTEDKVDLPLCHLAGFTQDTVSVRVTQSIPPATFGGSSTVLQRLLTNLGDLSRYSSDLRPKECPPALAARYYYQAVLISPSVGRPHNQLGTLAGSSCYGLQAAYHYLRCVTCHDAFDGGLVNLRKLLEKNHAHRVELEMEFGNSQVPARRRLIITFLDVIYGATLLEGAKQHRFVRLCQETLQWLSFCLQPSDADGGLVSINGLPLGGALEPKTVLLMVAVVILALQTLKDDAAPASGLRAFLLAAFSCLVGCVTTRLSARFPGITTPAVTDVTTSEQTNHSTTRRTRGSHRRKRGRRRTAQGKADDSDDDDDQLVSAPLSGSDDSEADSDSASVSSLESDDSEREESGVAADRPDTTQLVQALCAEGLLIPLRLCCDWLRSNEEVLKSCSESSANLWRQLVTLVNAVSVDLQPDSSVPGVRSEFVHQYCAGASSLAATSPLWEDRLLRGVDLLGTRHQHMVWSSAQGQPLTEAEEALLRVQLLVDFTTWLVSVPQLGVTLSAGKFVHVSSSSSHGAGSHDNNNELDTTQNKNHESGERRRQLMTTMAEQWLRSEVRSLRSRTARGRGGRASFSPYVVVDTAALVDHLPELKQMTKARQFVTVVPAAVIHELDERKAGCGAAREASRWLETQFRRGNRFLRPQRANEKASLQMVKYPRRKQREQWHFFQILECCSHLSQSVPAAGEMAPPSVTLLVGAEEAPPGREFSPRGLASAAGIHFELITTFHSKWTVSDKCRS